MSALATPRERGRLLVTGGTGLVGSATIAAARGRYASVRALVREGADDGALRELGAEIVLGDVTDPASLARAMDGVTEVAHTAALLGGAWATATPEQMWAVNHGGTVNVLETAAAAGVQRVAVVDTQSILDSEHTHTEDAPIAPFRPFDSPYVSSKRAAYFAAMHRAAWCEQDIVFVTPGPLYGPGIVVERALHPTSFTRVLLDALRGELASFVHFPMTWSYAPDVAAMVLATLAGGSRGRRYLSMCRDDEVCSLAEFCNHAAQLAGSAHRVIDLDPTDPNGPDIGSMTQFAQRRYASPLVDASRSRALPGATSTPLNVGLRDTIAWLREIGRLPSEQRVG